MADGNLERLDTMAAEAAALNNQGNHDKAEKLQRIIFDENTRLKGRNDRATLFSEGKLAQTLCYQKRFSEAENTQRKLVELFRTMYGCDDWDTLGVTSNLVVTYCDQHKYREAGCLATELLSQQRKLLGIRSSEALETELKLAKILCCQGRFEEAADMQRSVLHERRNSKNVAHSRGLADAIVDYSGSLIDLGKADGVSGLLEEALMIFENSVGSEAIDFLCCKAMLAQVYSCEGRSEEAIKTGYETLQSRKQLLGEKHPHTICSMSDQAAFLAQASRWQASMKEIGCAVELARRYLGDGHRRTISIANHAAHLYRDMALTDNAEQLAHMSFHEAQRLMGTDHPETLSAMFLYSQIQFEQGDYLPAMHGMRLCILRTRRTHEGNHSLTLYREHELAAKEKIYNSLIGEESSEKDEGVLVGRD